MSLKEIQKAVSKEIVQVPPVSEWQQGNAQAILKSNARLAKMSKAEKVAQLRRNASSKIS